MKNFSVIFTNIIIACFLICIGLSACSSAKSDSLPNQPESLDSTATTQIINATGTVISSFYLQNRFPPSAKGYLIPANESLVYRVCSPGLAGKTVYIFVMGVLDSINHPDISSKFQQQATKDCVDIELSPDLTISRTYRVMASLSAITDDTVKTFTQDGCSSDGHQICNSTFYDIYQNY